MSAGSIRLRAITATSVIGLLSAVAACGPQWGDAYLDAMAAGQRAQHAGRYEEAQRAYEQATRDAQRLKDRDEAMLLVARMLERQGKLDEAKEAYQKIVDAKPPGPRLGRAEIAIAEILMRQGSEPEGYARLEAFARKYPTHGDARPAIMRLIDRAREQGGAEATLTWLRAQQPHFASTELAQLFEYEIAKALQDKGDTAGARDAFVATARAHPYPLGPFTDDAFFRAAELELSLGRPKEAITLLREMLSALEESGNPGRYERPRFPAAQRKIADIYRDVLHDRANARRELKRLCADHPKTVMCDDALWDAARLAVEEGDTSDACDLVERIASTYPDSRYVRCQKELCPTAPASESPCARYILRDLGREPNEE